MENKKDILDEAFEETNEIGADQLTTQIHLQAIVYFIIMAIAGMAYSYFGTPQLVGDPIMRAIGFSVSTILWCLILSLILEAFRMFFRKRKFKKTGIKVHTDPFWFAVVEGGFAIWIILTVILIVKLIVSS